MPASNKILSEFEKGQRLFFNRTFTLSGFLLVLLIFTGGAESISAQNRETKSSTNKTALKPSSCGLPDNLKTNSQIRIFLEKARSYQNKSVRGRSIIDLSSLLWECDEDYARSSFLSLWQEITGEIENAKIKQKNLVTNTQEELNNLNRTISVNKFIQQYLVSKLKNLDQSLTAQLSKKLTSEEKGSADFLSIEGNLDAGNLSQQQLNLMRQILRNNPASHRSCFFLI